MAKIYAVEYGILDGEQAAKMYEEVLVHKASQRNGRSTSYSSTSSHPKKKHKAKRSNIIMDDVVVDTGLQAGSGFEAATGSMAL